MSVLVDQHGRPITIRKAKSSPMDLLAELGAKVTEDGVTIDRETLERRARERARVHTMSRVPSVPRDVLRAHGPAAEKGLGRRRSLTFRQLRNLRERSLLVQAIHAARRAGIRQYGRKWSGQEGDVGWSVRHRRHTDRDFRVPDEFKPFITRAEQIIERPSARYCRSFMGALMQLEEDLLTINRPAVEILPSVWDHNRIAGWRPLDGGILWPTLEWLELWVARQPGEVRTVEQAIDEASAAVGFDLHGAEYALVREGNVEAVYAPGELLVEPMQTRTDIEHAGYPPGQLEDAILAVTAFINAWVYNDSRFTKGMLAEFAIGLSGDVHHEDVSAFQEQLRQATSGVERAHQPPIIPLPIDGLIQRIELGAAAGDMAFSEWMSAITAIACSIYRMDPSSINMKPWDSSGGPKLSESSRAEEIQSAKQEGLVGDLEHLAESVLNPIVQRIHPDLVFVFETGENKAKARAELAEMRSKIDLTRNEIRIEHGLEPIGFYVPAEKVVKLSKEELKRYNQNPWNHTSDGQMGSFINQVAMQEQMAGGGEDPDGFGGGPEEGGFPFGRDPDDEEQAAAGAQPDPRQRGPEQEQEQEQELPDEYNMTKAELDAQIAELLGL